MNNRIITDITNFIFVSDELEKVDAIFLPGGSHPEQPEYAAELYHRGYAKWLIPSGGISVKRDKWPGEEQSGNTRDNAFFSRRVIDKRGIDIKTALIVCKAFHARRCLMLYQMAFPYVDIKVCPVHCYNITKDNWYKSETGIDRVLGELARCGNQFAGDVKQYVL